MHRAIVVALLLVLAVPLAPAAPAEAHQPNRFSVCFVRSSTANRCISGVGGTRSTVHLRGVISGHGGPVRVMFRPTLSGDRFRSLGSPLIRPNGVIRFSWRPPPGPGSYQFYLWKVGHGRTRIIEFDVYGGR